MADSKGPVLTNDTPFPPWQSNAKAFLKSKEVYTWSHTSAPSFPTGEQSVAIDKCAGLLWGMLSQEVQPLVRQHEDNPKAMWESLANFLLQRRLEFASMPTEHSPPFVSEKESLFCLLLVVSLQQ
jgi:hypothetical protein